jgi:hypothetical protein
MTSLFIDSQAFTFYASEDKLVNRGNKAGQTIGVEAINRFTTFSNHSLSVSKDFPISLESKKY